MKIVVDEHIPLMTVQALRAMGHEVYDLRGTPDEGMPDEKLWRMAQQQRRLLITTDKGFTQHRIERHHGVLIVRLRQPNRHRIHQRIIQAMDQFAATDWPGLIVTMRDRVQSRWRAEESWDA